MRLLQEDGTEVAKLTLVSCSATAGKTHGSLGMIVANGGVATGDGVIEVIQLQPEGKRPMTVQAFRNGHPWSEGMRLESI